MAGSRTAHNAKLVQRHQRQQSNALAKSTANKFTQKQSHFEQRREEEQIRQQSGSHGDGAFGGTPTATRNVGEGMLSRGGPGGFSGGGGGGRRYGAAAAAADDDVRDTPNPFDRMRTSNLRSGPASTAAPASTRSATMGLEKALKTTRTTRRIDRFNLSGATGAPHGGGGAGDGGGAASLMGVRRLREGEEAHGLDALTDPASAEGAVQPSKLTRAEKFREMISNSKGQRAQLQRERAERDAATLQLDAEINGLLHLLPKRNKTEEEQEAFAQSGTPEVRALLASYRRGHEAKCLTLKASGDFEVRTLAEAARAAPQNTTTTTTHADPTAAPEATSTATTASAPAFLDAADRALLAKIRAGAARSAEEEVNAAAAPPRFITPPLSRQAAADAAEARAAAPVAVRDDFDAMLQAFQLDPRRAHAVARTLTVEEEAEQQARQELLMADRQQVPSLQLQERDQTQLTRGEWVGQGGDHAFQMDDDEAGGDETGFGGDDNVDIPSSFEGDSEAGDEDGTDVEGEYEEEEAASDMDSEAAAGPAAAPLRTPTERVSGSQTLDHLLEELEKLATTTTTSTGKTEESASSLPLKQQALHPLLVQLHRHASQHVVEATKAFRLILVEAERSFLRGTRRGGIRRALLVYLYAITKIFPTSDYRHEVITPFLLFVCSALMQMKLDSLEAVHSYLVLTTLLLHCLKAGSGRYCAEVVVAVLNVLALQLPRAVLEPVRYQGAALPIPLMDRPEEAVLNSSAAASPATAAASDAADDASVSSPKAEGRPAYQIGILDSTHDPERLLLCAYRLYDELCDLYRTTPAFPVMCATPFLSLDQLLLQPAKTAGGGWQPTRAVRLAHEALAVKLRDTATAVKDHRTPLAMRTFRPRPIRQFDPLLAEREENAVKNEVRIMKRDIREDKKRLMRHLTAEATVQRRAQEKRAAVDDAVREKRYHNVMNQLQQQQHSMNTVESLKSRAKAAKKKGISGESNAKAANSEDAE